MKSLSLSAALSSGRASLRPMVAGIGALTLAVSVGLAVGPAQAVHNEGFELDAGVIDTDATTSDGYGLRNDGFVDWVDLFDVNPTTGAVTKKSTLPSGFVDAAFRADFALPDLTGYATGSKDSLPISLAGQGDWQCKSPNNLGDKFDLLNAYAGAKIGTASGDVGDVIVYFGSEVSAPEGNRNMGVWLLQDRNVNCQGTGNTDFSGSHEYGDAFIVAAFTGGGAVATIDVYEWVDKTPATEDDPDVNGKLELRGSVSPAPCLSPPAADDACATSNTDGDKDGAEIGYVINPPWPSPDKDGGDLGEAQFMEGAVNLTDFGLTGCFSTFLANSRSSQELGSTIHDFARADFNTCATVSGTKYKDANANGQKDLTEAGLSGWTFDLRQGTATSGAVFRTATSDADGNYSFGSVPAGQYTVVERPQTGWLKTEPTTLGRTFNAGAGGTVVIQPFGNTPLSDIDVTFTPLTSSPARTASTISCTGPTQPSGGPGTLQSSQTDGSYAGDSLIVGTYVCTIVITDP